MKLHLVIFSLSTGLLLSCNNENQTGSNSQDSTSPDQTMMDDNGMMGKDGMGMMQDEMMSEEMAEAMMSKGMGPEVMEDMMAIRKLLMQHEKINHRVKNLKNRVKTRTSSEDIENGVIVIENSEDPQVVKLIQQHADRAVSEFVEQGMQRAMQPTPLPEGYKK